MSAARHKAINIRWNFNRRYQYSVETSTDQVNWSKQVDQLWSSDIQWHEIDFTPTTARYVRVTFHRVDGETTQWAGLYAAQVWGEEQGGDNNQNFVLPNERQANWSQAGVANSIPTYPVSINVKDRGAVGDGLHDDTQAIRNAINDAPVGTAVKLPQGTYRITDTIIIDKPIVLRGDDYLHTVIHCDKGEIHCIRLGNSTNRSCKSANNTGCVALRSGLSRGTEQVQLANADDFAVGDLIEFWQDNDPALIVPGEGGYLWSEQAIGQMSEVIEKNGDTLTINPPLYTDYNARYSPRVLKKTPVIGAGVENLKILRTAYTSSADIISIVQAQDSWVKGVWTQKAGDTHIRVASSFRIEVRDGISYDGHVFSGGKSYGARLEGHTTNALVENNTFVRTRHAMLAQNAATANVFGYNFSVIALGNNGPDQFFYPSSDISAHGHYSNKNLWEGNTAEMAIMDRFWGNNNANVLFRNRVMQPRSDRHAIAIQAQNPNHSIIGNETGLVAHDNGLSTINVDQSVQNSTLEHGNYNYVGNKTQWDNRYSHNLPPSLYLKSKPRFINNGWPVFGPDVSNRNRLLEAEQRYLDLQPILQ